MNKIRVVLADDHDIVRNGIKQLLDKETDIEVVGEAADGEEAVQKVEELSPDVLVMDVGMPKMNGIEAIRALKEKGLETKVLILSMFDVEEYVLKAVEFGALGYVLKDADKMKFLDAIRTVYDGKKYYGHDISSFIVEKYLDTMSQSGIVKKKNQVDAELSNREISILSEIVRGKSNKFIAEEMGVSVRTIESHRLNMMKKLKVANVAEMVRVAIEGGLV